MTTASTGSAELGRFPALWEVLAEAGRRGVVLDVPLAPLSSRLRGPQVVEWGVHDAVFGFRTRPASLAERIERVHGRHPAPPLCDATRDPAEARAFAEQLVAGAGARGGEVVGMGRPEDLLNVPESFTGRFLAPLLRGSGSPSS